MSGAQSAGAGVPEASKPVLRQFTPYEMMETQLRGARCAIEELRDFSARRPHDSDLELGMVQLTKGVDDLIALVALRIEQEREDAS